MSCTPSKPSIPPSRYWRSGSTPRPPRFTTSLRSDIKLHSFSSRPLRVKKTTIRSRFIPNPTVWFSTNGNTNGLPLSESVHVAPSIIAVHGNRSTVREPGNRKFGYGRHAKPIAMEASCGSCRVGSNLDLRAYRCRGVRPPLFIAGKRAARSTQTLYLGNSLASVQGGEGSDGSGCCTSP